MILAGERIFSQRRDPLEPCHGLVRAFRLAAVVRHVGITVRGQRYSQHRPCHERAFRGASRRQSPISSLTFGGHNPLIASAPIQLTKVIADSVNQTHP